MRKLLVSISIMMLCAACFSGNSHALLNEMGIEPLSIRGGGRPIGMGWAFTGIADDVNALLYNPAGIARTKGIGVTVRDLGNFSALQVYPSGYGLSFGFGLVRKASSDLVFSGNQYDTSGNIIVGALGWRLQFLSDMFGLAAFKDIDVGLSAKYVLGWTLRNITSIEADRSATGWDGDVGIIWRASPWIKIGMTFENIIGDDTSGGLKWNTGEKDETKAATVIGVGLKVVGDKRSPIYLEDNELLLVSDVRMRSDAPETLASFGAEWTYAGTYIARVGMGQAPKGGEAVSQSTAGVGVRFGNWGADFAVSQDYLTDSSLAYFSFIYWPREWLFVKKAPVAEDEIRKQAKEESKENPELVKVNIPEEQVTDGDTVKVHGEVLKPNAKVYVNNNMAAVDKQGKFSVDVPLNTGKNLVEIVTVFDGKKTIVKRKILKKAKVVTPEDVKIEEKVQKEIVPKEASIAVKEEKVIRPKEEKIVNAEQKITELEKEPLTELEKKALVIEKKKIEAEKKEVAILKAKVVEEKKALAIEKNKIEAAKKNIAEKKAAVEDLATLGIIDVSPNKVFEVESAITRGELASWLTKARGLSVAPLSRAPFKDVPANHPFAAQIKAAVDAGFMSTYPDGTFRPAEPVKESDGVEIFKKYSGR